MGLLKKLFSGKRYPVNGKITINGKQHKIMRAKAGNNSYLPYWYVYGTCNAPQHIIEKDLNLQGYTLKKLGGNGNICMTIKIKK